MERKIGEIFEYNGEWYQCVKGGIYCPDCVFFRKKCNSQVLGGCAASTRSDKEEVIFKKLEKVGETYEYAGHIFQEYHVFEEPIFTENYATIREFGVKSKISIEIKQTKEDMEGKGITLDDAIKYCSDAGKHSASIDCKIINYKIRDWLTELKQYKDKERFNSESTEKDLKSFSLEAAKAGKPVCTRDGRKARIICFDRDWDMHIVALVTGSLGEEVHYYLSNGQVDFDKQNDDDLMMLPEKKEGWVNIYKEGVDKYIYNNEKVALSRRGSDCIATIKIEWEE